MWDIWSLYVLHFSPQFDALHLLSKSPAVYYKMGPNIMDENHVSSSTHDHMTSKWLTMVESFENMLRMQAATGSHLTTATVNERNATCICALGQKSTVIGEAVSMHRLCPVGLRSLKNIRHNSSQQQVRPQYSPLAALHSTPHIHHRHHTHGKGKGNGNQASSSRLSALGLSDT
jgi:hypothetical protein